MAKLLPYKCKYCGDIFRIKQHEDKCFFIHWQAITLILKRKHDMTLRHFLIMFGRYSSITRTRLKRLLLEGGHETRETLSKRIRKATEGELGPRGHFEGSAKFGFRRCKVCSIGIHENPPMIRGVAHMGAYDCAGMCLHCASKVPLIKNGYDLMSICEGVLNDG